MLNTAITSRDYLARLFSSMDITDTKWAIKTLTDRLYMFGKEASRKVEAKQMSPHIELPEAVLKMTMRHRKCVSYDTYEDYSADMTAILEEKHA